MLNFFLCIIWSLLIFGTIGAFIMGKKRLGSKGAWLLAVTYVVVAILVMWLVFGEVLWWHMSNPYISP
jgi:hypothetical protein